MDAISRDTITDLRLPEPDAVMGRHAPYSRLNNAAVSRLPYQSAAAAPRYIRQSAVCLLIWRFIITMPFTKCLQVGAVST